MPRVEPFPYRIEVLYSTDDECYVARVPSLPGCAAHGSTPEEATAEVRIAASNMLEVMHEHGDPVPRPDLATRTAS
jgi:predicted RNase H-like HicB family nuclease